MANVNQINETTPPVSRPAKNKPRASEGGNAFDTMLSSALEKSEGREGAEEVSGLQELAAPRFDLQTPSDLVSGKTEGLLGLLDNYAAQLENPRVSLKSIAPVLEQINEEALELMKEAKLLDTEDNGLKDIATRTALAAQTEYVKFQRGDYLS